MLARPAVLAALVALPLALAACGSDGAGSGDAGADGRLSIVTSFYPLQYVTGRITGDRADITDLTPSGAEPHDLELTPKNVGTIADADLIVYLGGGFQPAVDDAVANEGADHALDIAPGADLSRMLASNEHEEKGEQVDPHFWLDPVRLSAVSTQIAQRLEQDDPAGAGNYQANLKSLTAELTTLSEEYTAGLKNCANTDVVTSHSAFGYLAQRYGLTQVGILGLSPDAEPEAAKLAEVTDFVRANNVRTIYYETLVSPAIARTVASETGARTAVLDPLESITSESQGTDYLGVMRSNLANLKQGQPCQ